MKEWMNLNCVGWISGYICVYISSFMASDFLQGQVGDADNRWDGAEWC